MKEAAFAILHEGKINKITGLIPGTLTLEVQCDYLRSRLSARGHTFLIELEGCSKLEFVNNLDKRTSDFQQILGYQSEILSADVQGNDVLVFCNNGTLELQFKSANVKLNYQETISIDQLEDVARSYWDEWEHKNIRALSL